MNISNKAHKQPGQTVCFLNLI